MGLLLGVVDSTSITYQFLRDGSVLPQGSPQMRRFSLKEYEGYISDSYRMRHDLTLTFGLRYSNSRPPYETSGLQVAPNIGLNQLFAERNGLQAQGVPGNAMAHAQISYSLNGPANHQPSWYGPDNTTLPRGCRWRTALRILADWPARSLGRAASSASAPPWFTTGLEAN